MGYYIPYSSIDQFIATTVHSAPAHNTPHNRLLDNDIQLDNRVHDITGLILTLQSQVATLSSGVIKGVSVDYLAGPVSLGDGGVGGDSVYYLLRGFSFTKQSATSKILHFASFDGYMTPSGDRPSKQSYKLWNSQGSYVASSRRQLMPAAYVASGVGVNAYYSSGTSFSLVTGMGAGSQSVALYGNFDHNSGFAQFGSTYNIQQLVLEFESA